MKVLWVALVLSLSAFAPGKLSAQGTSTHTGRASGQGLELGQNYPNPLTLDTKIPFSIGDANGGCSDPSRLYRVTLRVYNVLAQPVAVPVLQVGSGNAGGDPIDRLFLTCGQYTAYWDGKDTRTQSEVASGVYLYRLEVDGKPLVKKMLVSK
jgi:hypothetical protein